MLKGIDGEITAEEIKQSIEDKYSIKVENIYRLRNTLRNNFMVVTDNSIFLKFLNNNVKYVCYTRITWERYQNRSSVIQCRRCQQWGHSTTNCRSKPTCTKCGEPHWTKECDKVRKEDPNTHENIKCANCKGSHLAFSKECPVYKKRVEATEAKKQKISPINKRPNYVPAPLPATNPWTNNRGNPWTSKEVIEPNVSNAPQINDSQLNFNNMVSEFQTLNQLIDIDKMVRLVRELNSQLRGCNSEFEKFMHFNKFCQTLFKATESELNRCLPQDAVAGTQMGSELALQSCEYSSSLIS